MAQPGTRVIAEKDHGTVAVDSVQLRITELVWNDIEGRSFEVHRVGTGEDLTVNGCFDNYPTLPELRALLA